MDEKIVNGCLHAYAKTNRLLTTLLVVAGAALVLQNKKIDKLSRELQVLNSVKGD